tara:strand:- start:4906 stop:5547 length:642 start_codon:yes stop_codon:yes gene_type:complete
MSAEGVPSKGVPLLQEIILSKIIPEQALILAKDLIYRPKPGRTKCNNEYLDEYLKKYFKQPFEGDESSYVVRQCLMERPDELKNAVKDALKSMSNDDVLRIVEEKELTEDMILNVSGTGVDITTLELPRDITAVVMYDQGEFDRYNILQGDEYGVQIFCSNNSHITVYLDEKLRAKKKFRKVIEKVTYVDLVTLRGRAKREDRKKKSMGVLRL